MKKFISIFIMSFITCYVFLFFAGAFIFENFWAQLTLIALVIAILASLFVHYESKIDELEKRIQKLED